MRVSGIRPLFQMEGQKGWRRGGVLKNSPGQERRILERTEKMNGNNVIMNYT